MQEILLSLGGLLIVQIGLTVRKWISEHRSKESNKKIKEDLLSIISDLRNETNVFKNQIKGFTLKMDELKKENKILAKQYNDVLRNYKDVKKQLQNIETYAKFSKDLKTFEYQKICYSLDLINSKNSSKKLNEQLRFFLETGSKSLVRIMYKTLSHGLDNVNIQAIESDFKENEHCLRFAFSCEQMEVNKEDLETIIYTEKGKYLTQLRKITDEETGIKNKDSLRNEYLDICDKLLENIIIGVKNI